MSGSVIQSLSQLVQTFESQGQYGIYQQQGKSSASGAYQFLDQTWQHYAGQIGVDTSTYPRAAMAPPNVQDAVFAQAVAVNGLGDWTCAGCNPKLSNYLAANPSAAGLPVLPGGSPATGISPGLASSATPDGGSAPPVSPGASTTAPAGSGASLNPASWLPALSDWFASIAGRAGLFILAVIFIIGALLLFGIKSGISIETSAAK
jgi:hypothetical protein